MTPQELIKEFHKLPSPQKQEFLESISSDTKQKQYISEDEVERLLYERGIIGKPSNLDEYDDDDFEPVEIKGEPLSETIIRERR